MELIKKLPSSLRHPFCRPLHNNPIGTLSEFIQAQLGMIRKHHKIRLRNFADRL
jgi:hypothetical protein